ncbi:MAG: tRNA (adenosine(37)-N6)-threonylcarbamoyltransferase complex ATPase subunit type 1 TsaE [Candidatus Ryanbacteria bacterium]|nr:tRNA (adenosine(37)-N6)-threonylcarbamoyltransferase complex ATPase subunit type 1 TsaE [Candidatus Ryanbacteria bacterium]
MSGFLSKNPNATKKAGELLGRELRDFIWQGPRAFFITLSGELGSGKTLFTKGIARGLGVRGLVHSPTFLLMKRYPLSKSLFFKNLWHVDCYRVEDPKELFVVGFRDIAQDPENIVVVEWPERIKKSITKDSFQVSFEHDSPSTRKLFFHT